MALSAEFTYPGYRDTEVTGNDRITEDGNPRSLELPNAGLATFAAEGTLTAFVGSIYAKNSSSWQVPTSYVKEAGLWVTSGVTGYYNETGTWKRIL